MSLLVRFLGTSASRPTVERGLSAVAIHREGETLLFDCGEGTQRQMMRYGVSFALADIFFTHFHTDHVVGLIGLLKTLQLQGRTEVMRLYGPRGAHRLLREAVSFGGDRLGFPVEISEVEPGQPIARTDYAIHPFPVEHAGTVAVGYALVEAERRGRFHPDLARAFGIPEGPLWGRLHRGERITLDDGREIDAATLVGPTRPGRIVVLTGDTRPCAATIQAAHGADLLIHEATFSHDEAARALETGHSTASEAAQVAKLAQVRQLVLTHISARYSRDARELEQEAAAHFPAVRVARDGMEVDVPFVIEGDATPVASTLTAS
ncbi:MAG: ribonuclease Z [Gemmatimonadaceae bacterium]|nr:ribonuclease Z [Gemmatimonadaceae bacterium]